jgi:hypothetical protein
MWTRLASFMALSAVFVAGGLALFRTDGEAPGSAQASATTANHDDMLRSKSTEMLPPDHPPIGAMNARPEATLPPNHPPIGEATSPHGNLTAAAGEGPALEWKVPGRWQEAPNPNAMRLATYRAPGGVEVSVSQAGGTADANIKRWIAQFDDISRHERGEKKVHGLRVFTVDVTGTFVGGGMATQGAPESRPNWAMVGAIVEGPGLPYFFKMTGPAAAVLAAHPAFDQLIETVMPT